MDQEECSENEAFGHHELNTAIYILYRTIVTVIPLQKVEGDDEFIEAMGDCDTWFTCVTGV